MRFHLLFNLKKGINKRLKGAKRGGMMSKSLVHSPQSIVHSPQSLKMWNLNPCWSGSSRGYEFKNSRVQVFKILRGLIGIGIFALLQFGCTPKLEVPIDLIEEATSEKYEEANGIILFDSTQVRIKQNGIVICREHTLVKILSTYGKKKFGESTFPYFTETSELEINLARVITPKGKVIKVPDENIKDVPFIPMGGTAGAMFLQDVRMKKVIFPEIEIGSSVECIVTVKFSTPLMPNRFTDMILFEDEEPIKEKIYTLEFPKGVEMKHIVKNGELSFSEEESEGRVTYKWESHNVPRITKEPMMPPLEEVATMLVLSDIPTWQEVSRWYYEISEASISADSAIKDKVAELTDTLKTQEEKIRAIFDFVSMEVRYLQTEAISKEKGANPRPASLTFERRWGVCRDKAALFVTMAKEIGVSAEIVLIDVNYHTPVEIPSPLFEHVIVAIKRANGTYYYLDPTAEYTREYFPVAEQDRDLLVCTKEGDSLRFAPYENIENNWLLTENTGTLNANGDLEGILTMQGEGLMDMGLRFFRYIPPEQLRQIFEQMVKGLSPEATLDTFELGDPVDLSKRFAIKLQYRAPEYAIKKGNELHLTSSGGESSFSLGAGMAGSGGSPWGLEERKYALYFQFPMLTRSINTFTLPKRYKVKELPDDYKFEHPRWSVLLTKKEKAGKLTERNEFFLKTALIPVEEYKEFRSVMEDLEKQGKKDIVLIKEK